MRILLIALALSAAACSRTDSVKIADNKPAIDSNTLRIELIEAEQLLQNTKISNLETRVSALEAEVAALWEKVEANSLDIGNLFDDLDNLDSELAEKVRYFKSEILRLKRTDKKQWRSINNLRRKICKEVRDRKLADSALQSQIDKLDRDLSSFEARQSVINRFLSRGLYHTNLRISQLQSRITRELNRLDRKITISITALRAEITNINSQITNINSELDALGAAVTQVVYPCGEENSEEVLLKISDKLVAYYQEMQNVTETFKIGIRIPEHFICDRFVGRGNICHYGRNIPARTAKDKESVTYSVLTKAYLDVLADGSYTTTDGYSCTFTVSDGEVIND